MSLKYKIAIFFAIAISFSLTSCKKYLDVKANSNLTTPETAKDLWAILYYSNFLNMASHSANEGADEFYFTPEIVDILPETYKGPYLWDPIAQTEDWLILYRSLLAANSALDNLKAISSQNERNQIKAAALFYRAHLFFQLAQIYAKQYDPTTAASDLGIALRLTSDFNQLTVRATVQQTYDRIVEDLEESLPLLPISPLFKTRPGRPAAHALLARVYLQMGDYTKAKASASECLNLYNHLMDYSELDITSNAHFPLFNDEVIFYAFNNASLIGSSLEKMEPTLYNSFEAEDLRKALFFRSNGDDTFSFKGSYNGPGFLFQGIAVDEVYLIKAECEARAGDVNAAMQSLNALLRKRWKKDYFTEFTASNAEDALTKILNERRKELMCRGLRWLDLKRLNKDPKFAVTLKRVSNGQTHTLPPNDPRYALPIPQTVINMTGIPQNER